MVEPVLHALVSPFVHAAPGNAVITHFNPADVYNATFNASTTKSGIHGFVGGVAPLDGTGIRFHVEIAGFDLATGPFSEYSLILPL